MKVSLNILSAGNVGCTPTRIHLDQNVKISKTDGELLSNPTVYMRLIGRLLYLNITRPDLSHTIQ